MSLPVEAVNEMAAYRPVKIVKRDDSERDRVRSVEINMMRELIDRYYDKAMEHMQRRRAIKAAA